MNKDCFDCLKYESIIKAIEIKLADIRNIKARYCHNELLIEALNTRLDKEKNNLEQVILERNRHLLRSHV